MRILWEKPLTILYIALLEWKSNELIFYQLRIKSLLIQNHQVALWIGQSKEYQELLGAEWLIINCFLEITV